MDLKKALGVLQDKMATTDLFARSTSHSAVEFLIKRYQNIALRMDGNNNHKRPHIHIDYGTRPHSASYAIDNGERLAGDLENRHDTDVKAWIGKHQIKLLQAWEITQAGQKPDALISYLKGTKYG